MPRTRAPYSLEFRQQMVELVRAGRTPEELSREFEPAQKVGIDLGMWIAGAWRLVNRLAAHEPHQPAHPLAPHAIIRGAAGAGPSGASRTTASPEPARR